MLDGMGIDIILTSDFLMSRKATRRYGLDEPICSCAASSDP